ncbi:hypothetical protein LBBP_03748 [Leptospira borgpetersenii serovar Ballum]|uniref:Uncharacterized protein n=1 Tax=Leptospira borgpetersenii serovar Ballum TaxID=280505 RepID=A0A0S2IWP5_LEPBO|nr:hypothetical protein LBBP_03748 [Leptospira borgpetersenii serovar Ballum]
MVFYKIQETLRMNKAIIPTKNPYQNCLHSEDGRLTNSLRSF